MCDHSAMTQTRKDVFHFYGLLRTSIFYAVLPAAWLFFSAGLKTAVDVFVSVTLISLIFLTLIAAFNYCLGVSVSISASKHLISVKLGYSSRTTLPGKCGWFRGSTIEEMIGHFGRKKAAIIICVGANSFWSSNYRVAICGDPKELKEWESFLTQIGMPHRQNWRFPFAKKSGKHCQTQLDYPAGSMQR